MILTIPDHEWKNMVAFFEASQKYGDMLLDIKDETKFFQPTPEQGRRIRAATMAINNRIIGCSYIMRGGWR